jgi:hypothetical protein
MRIALLADEMKPRTPPSPQDTQAWDAEAHKLMLVSYPLYELYSRRVILAPTPGYSGLAHLGFRELSVQADREYGIALVSACIRLKDSLR